MIGVKVRGALLVLMGAGLLLGGCAGGPDTTTPVAAPPTPNSPTAIPPTAMPPTAAVPGSPTPGATPAPATPGTPGAVTWPPEADLAVQNAKREVEKAAGPVARPVTVVSVTPQDWPNTALGCPQPGVAYLQVITPGYLIVLDVGGTPRTFHASRKGDVVQCGP